jgi:calcium-dependent protein kinase
MGSGASSHDNTAEDITRVVRELYSKDPEKAKHLVESAERALKEAQSVPRHQPTKLLGAQKAAFSGGGLVEHMVHQEFNRDVNDIYECHKAEKLGEGLSGQVIKVYHKTTKVPYAMKTLRLEKKHPKSSLAELKKEIAIMAELDHPNIVRLIETFYTESAVFLIMELCEGGELFDHLLSVNSFGEKEACDISRKIVAATRYLHDHNIVHRDLKLENVLFTGKDNDSELKLCDFGLSDHFKTGRHMHSTLGTPYYIAPEVLKGNYDQKCDCWSIGLIAYMLLSGSPPFPGTSNQEIMDSVKLGKFDFTSFDKGISPKAKDFVRKCLSMDIDERPECDELLRHPWLNSEDHLAAISSPVNESVLGNLVNFRKFSALKRIALEVVAFSLEPGQIENLRADFEKFDAEQNGEISVKEFHQVLDSKMSPEEVSKIFESIDLDHTGVVHWHEFLAAAVDTQAVDDAHLRLAFDHLDHDKKGFITPQDVEEIMGEDAKHSEVSQMFSELDKAEIDEKTFVKLCRSQTMEKRGTMRSRNTIIMSSPANRSVMTKSSDFRDG